jgi:CRISPR/Cas system CMR-associated protein Cmr5 small subunit
MCFVLHEGGEMNRTAFIVFIMLTIGGTVRSPADESRSWANEKGILVPVNELSDAQMVFYVEGFGYDHLAKNCPSFCAELKRRKLFKKDLKTNIQNSPKTSQSLPRITPRQLPQSTSQTPSKYDAATRTAVDNYARRLQSIVRLGKIRMEGHRRTIALYRSFQAIEAIGYLQWIDNLAVENISHLNKMQKIADFLLDSENVPQDRLDFYVKRAKFLAEEINENQSTIEWEFKRIKFREKQLRNPYRFNHGRGLH